MKNIKEFILSYYFNAWRNSMVNWNNYVAWRLGRKIGVIKKWGNVNSFIELRKFSSADRLYTEFFLFGKWFQFGFISNGRFEIDLFKTRTKK